MLKRKSIHEKGKLRLSRYFQDFKKGDRVALIKNLSFPSAFPKRFHGQIATVSGKQGKAFVVTLLNGKKHKSFVVNAIHLKKIGKAK